ncbi:hypothetical protein A2291_04105 [candidate division WOR-1 bacterium RIFOXYB2_FULL_42_35]|uniref:Membrane protein 6-pyruvoyl-tetrahydropterin synthase-related domain-containing protein n=1 Tax=candidate division WOR-1 bacterium RIFOXYC2_FULL_41_25 TaxID=1802586 RepID=A0A1F4TMV1_UNCSA|nr:MAG: hypothetical protein A2247_00945 [candidate division WOR-1 bacterium RIFOXYA2_FULL_41_14]OGC24314.1 MAG: hypothetical protein A2291_04105 [candidate division WOR-1 bacterium RIFOXYB2_FULL_42_35]OGC34016.1 MAG: hypothetical protein A2462_01510 [candidate division WOR-1 bacterium RIFOXYC2_FULL_41_25]
MKISKQDILVFCAYLGLLLLFFQRFLSGREILAFKDLSRYFYPLRYLMVEQVRAGTIPLWNPYNFCGYPLIATLQIGFFYPLSLIHYLLPFNLAFNYYTILHYFLAACFMYLMLRHFLLSYWASFYGGIIFTFSGYLLSVSNMNTSLSAVIWLPLIVIFCDRLRQERSYKFIVILALLLASQFLGGEPTIIYGTGLLLPAYLAVFSSTYKEFFKNLGALALSGLIAIGLVAVQLLPFVELARLSTRVGSTAFALVTSQSFPPREVINFFLPYFFGQQLPVASANSLAFLFTQATQAWLLSPYLGGITLLLVFLAFKTRKKLAWFFFSVVLVSLFLAFGCYTPFFKFAYLIPGISFIRYPTKYLFLTTFGLVVLSSLGFEQLLVLFTAQNKEAVSFLKRVAVFTMVLFSAFVVVTLLQNFILRGLAGKLPAGADYLARLLVEVLEFNLISVFNLALYLLGLIIILVMAYRQKISRAVLAFLIVLLVGLDLFANGYPIMVPVKFDFYREIKGNIKILNQDRALFRFLYTPELGMQNREICGKTYQDALGFAKDSLTDNWHILYGLNCFTGYASIPPKGDWNDFERYFSEAVIADNIDKLSLFNVKYVGSTKPLKSPSLKLLRQNSEYGRSVYLYENLTVKPRALMISGSGRVTLQKYRPREIIISAKVQEAGDLFLSERFYPGWKAVVDNEQVEIRREQNYFRSISLEKGNHQVVFLYEPLSFKLGTVISFLTAFGLCLGGYYYYRQSYQA